MLRHNDESEESQVRSINNTSYALSDIIRRNSLGNDATSLVPSTIQKMQNRLGDEKFPNLSPLKFTAEDETVNRILAIASARDATLSTRKKHVHVSKTQPAIKSIRNMNKDDKKHHT